MLTDPTRESSKAAELAFADARREGHRIQGLFGDLTQLGGVCVTRPPARLEYLHRSELAGDHPRMGELLSALDRAMARPTIAPPG